MIRFLIPAAFLCAFPHVIAGACACPQEAPPGVHREYDLSRLDLSRELRHEVEAALERKDYQTAEKILVDEAARDPRSPRAARLLELVGGLFFLDGQYSNSVIAWKKAEAIGQLDEKTRFTLAMAYIKINRRSWARSELERLVKAHPDNALDLYWLARIDYDDQQYPEAIGNLQTVVELDPRMARAYDLLGLCYDYTGHFDQAITSFTRAVELNRLQPTPSAWPALDMAITQLELNQLTNAKKSLQEAITYNPKLPQAQYQLGRVLEKEGENEQAIEALKASVAVDPNYPEPHYLLGRIYQRLGKNDLARAEILQFQKLKPPENAGKDLTPSH